ASRFLPSHRCRSFLHRPAAADDGTDLVAQEGEIALLGAERVGPRGACGTVAGHDAARRQAAQLVEQREPAEEAAVERRHAIDEQQVAGPERTRLPVEDAQVVVGMSWRMGADRQHPGRSSPTMTPRLAMAPRLAGITSA